MINETWSKIQNKLNQIYLPDGARAVLDVSSGPPITLHYAFFWNGTGEVPVIMMSRLAQQLERRLGSIGLTEVTAIYGEAEEEIFVEVDSVKMSSLELSYLDIVGALDACLLYTSPSPRD